MRAKTIGRMLAKGQDVIGVHVTMEKYLDGSVRSLLGTVRAIVVEDMPYFSCRLQVHFFNGEPWPVQPFPAQVEII